VDASPGAISGQIPLIRKAFTHKGFRSTCGEPENPEPGATIFLVIAHCFVAAAGPDEPPPKHWNCDHEPETFNVQHSTLNIQLFSLHGLRTSKLSVEC